MIRSKYLGKTYDAGWKCTAVELAGRYGRRNKKKGNSYRFFLTRETSDGKCVKSLCVGHRTMAKIGRGKTTVEEVEARKNAMEEANPFRNATFYRFVD